MNVQDIEKEVDEIRKVAGDYEAAHGMEDELWKRTLRAIARGAEDPAALASAALVTTTLDFPRYGA